MKPHTCPECNEVTEPVEREERDPPDGEMVLVRHKRSCSQCTPLISFPVNTPDDVVVALRMNQMKTVL